jgi:nitrogen-specific signal transduction histidine kinase
VTERARAEEQLRQTAKLESLGVLAGGVAHDFNNLLVGILGNASLAADAVAPDHPVRELLQDVVSASEQAAQLTRQLLAYAGKGRFFVEPVNLSELVKEISNLVRASISRSVALRLELGDELPCVDADGAQIQQLIMNLIINGAEAIGEGKTGSVVVTTGVRDVDEAYVQKTFGPTEQLAPGRYVSVQVRDTGCGMDQPTLARIFDPFFTTKFTGRGLGLAAAMGIVRGHKGSLTVSSTPGSGTTFEVLLPASNSKVRRAEAARAPAPSAVASTVLVVDDEEMVRRMAKTTLERHGYTVITGENGKEAVELFQQYGPSVGLVLLDMTMPVMGGEEASWKLQAINSDVKILLSSGFNEMEAVQRFSGRGLAGFLQKPYTSAALLNKIHDVLANPGLA